MDVKKAIIIIIIEFLRDDDVAKARALHHLDQKGQIRHVIQCETAHLPAFKHLGVEVAFGEIDRAGTRADRQRAESGREESRFAHLLLLLLLLLWCIKSERVENDEF